MIIERVCTQVEREFFEPHVERMFDAMRVIENLANAFEDRPGLKFDPSCYAWVREPEPTPKPEAEAV